MEVILGIDIGGSTTKIVGLRTDGSVISMLRVRAEDQVTSLYGALGNYLSSNGLSLQDVRPCCSHRRRRQLYRRGHLRSPHLPGG